MRQLSHSDSASGTALRHGPELLGRALKGAGARRVVSVEPVGLDRAMFDITTATGDFIADGVVSHNCFAPPHPGIVGELAAVARLNDAGVECGVLLAPVLPRISDGVDQLEAVVKACVEAGARSITPLLLHLRPGVREQYMGWPATARPDLVADYERRYPRAYASRRVQRELSATVAGMVARRRSAGGGRLVVGLLRLVVATLVVLLVGLGHTFDHFLGLGPHRLDAVAQLLEAGAVVGLAGCGTVVGGAAAVVVVVGVFVVVGVGPGVVVVAGIGVVVVGVFGRVRVVLGVVVLFSFAVGHPKVLPPNDSGYAFHHIRRQALSVRGVLGGRPLGRFMVSTLPLKNRCPPHTP
ncbi:MAG: hypothetical protein ACR2HV_01455 [Acidimicrobiales bacterium]